ncbi:MAG: hypothetical protein PHO32_09910, partial [Candidatus Cloacimonetes bacterium]|nr:hypothetical protein [Candidatus Cloacimonadota bacterium]
MKKNKLILLVILFVLVAAYFVLRFTRPEEKNSRIFDLDSLAIFSIEVFDANDSLRIEKQKDIWVLVSPVRWETDASRMQSLFTDVISARYPKTPMG